MAELRPANIASYLAVMATGSPTGWRWPARTAATDQAGQLHHLTFRQLDDASDQLAAASSVSASVAHRTALMCRRARLLPLTFALFKLGAIPS